MLINQIYSLSRVITDEACKIHFHLFAIIIFIIKMDLICQELILHPAAADRAALIGLIYAPRCNFIAFLKWFYKMDNP